jgi:hypothetical protein
MSETIDVLHTLSPSPSAIPTIPPSGVSSRSAKVDRVLDSEATAELQRLREFAGSLRTKLHEIKNALSPITMSLELLRDRFGGCELLEAAELGSAWTLRAVIDLQTAYHRAVDPTDDSSSGRFLA